MPGYSRVVLLALSALLACGDADRQKETNTEPAIGSKPSAPPTPWTGAAIAHAGASTPPEMSDGPRKAVHAALALLERGGDPLDAAVAGVVVMEDDPRFNAGTGSRVRIDGETVQMDASVMGSNGDFGAVAIIEKVRNPVRVARAVIDTPHNLLAGDGATRFARTLGMEPYEPATEEMRARTAEIVDKLRRADPELAPDWQAFPWRERWNFARTLEAAGLTGAELGSDTVGVAVRTADGRFAVALSTGGTPITLRGRVGDVPILGAGLYAGRHGAIAATGKGERIVEATFARRVHDQLATGVPLQTALDRAVTELREAGSIGVIAIGPDQLASAAAEPMAWAGRELGSTDWLGPEPSSP